MQDDGKDALGASCALLLHATSFICNLERAFAGPICTLRTSPPFFSRLTSTGWHCHIVSLKAWLFGFCRTPLTLGGDSVGTKAAAPT